VKVLKGAEKFLFLQNSVIFARNGGNKNGKYAKSKVMQNLN
jgi:hypothetical protein